jgi:M-phase inducer tyrosine phosphatase
METSSPLAALRPAPPTTFGQGNLFGQHLMPSPLGPFSFQRPNPEYFNLKTVRGSSPAASLAADLSQNFKLNDARLVQCPSPGDDSTYWLTQRNFAAVLCSRRPAERFSQRLQ